MVGEIYIRRSSSTSVTWVVVRYLSTLKVFIKMFRNALSDLFTEERLHDGENWNSNEFFYNFMFRDVYIILSC